ncbi:Alpha/Beta hydrolase protein [Thermothelomyces heterothallicus CBS 202.75]|uniref:Alpha/Beta hydrolase protein n=1 Tax=Thermothelomyces heterothallicus CBS 202.75 TaxID=1149848 RepID=UPI00374236EA
MASTIVSHPAPKPHSIYEYAGLARPPHLGRLESATHKSGVVESLSIGVDDEDDGYVPGFLHLPPDIFTTDAPPPSAAAAAPVSTKSSDQEEEEEGGGGGEPGGPTAEQTSQQQQEQQQQQQQHYQRPATAQPPHHHRTAAILLSGAGGGVTGPSSIYLSLACKLATLGRGIPTLRLDYRAAGRRESCAADARAGMAYLRDLYGLDRFVLVGWSLGGAVALSAAADDPRVVGCAAVASQMPVPVPVPLPGTEGEAVAARLPPRPLLLLHGSDDSTIGVECSRRLFDAYGTRDGAGAGAGAGDRALEIFEGDNHALSGNAERAEELLCEFVARCAGVRVGPREREDVVAAELVEGGERHALMERGGDLRQPECED